MPLYYDDLEPGQVFTLPARTVTETDLVNFAMLSGDWNPIHTDQEFTKGTIYGRPVVYGLFSVVMMTGLLDRSGLFSGSAMAMLDITDWRFEKPVFVGDTLHATVEIAGKRLTSGGDRGIVDRLFRIINQRGEVVQSGHIGLMIRCGPQSAENVS
ncbi:acyl dehydratase [Nocardioides massiliensis]|uniref:Acyl dehydratase n=1 Tax=Nocardioides massiliensis TaxID=1325935 RepID=A0ABT9NTE6_9ACTN|nr:MaoC/PaaZ C-terminal domain-containing protein [Nocardioides massiliensis]MDP9823668.1 acyl dehydratase [Nocardioides massiliensis]